MTTTNEYKPLREQCFLGPEGHFTFGFYKVGARFVCRKHIKDLTPAQAKRLVVIDEQTAKRAVGIEFTAKPKPKVKAAKKKATKTPAKKASKNKAA